MQQRSSHQGHPIYTVAGCIPTACHPQDLGAITSAFMLSWMLACSSARVSCSSASFLATSGSCLPRAALAACHTLRQRPVRPLADLTQHKLTQWVQVMTQGARPLVVLRVFQSTVNWFTLLGQACGASSQCVTHSAVPWRPATRPARVLCALLLTCTATSQSIASTLAVREGLYLYVPYSLVVNEACGSHE